MKVEFQEKRPNKVSYVSLFFEIEMSYSKKSGTVNLNLSAIVGLVDLSIFISTFGVAESVLPCLWRDFLVFD